MAIVGPLTSFTIGLLCLTAAWELGWSVAALADGTAGGSLPGAILGWLGYINVVLAIFNLLPAYPLDGGSVLRAMLWFGVAAYGAYLFLFLAVGVPWMPLVNGAMVLACSASLWLIARGRINLTLRRVTPP